MRQPYGSRTAKVHLSLRPCGRVGRAGLKRFKSKNDFVDASSSRDLRLASRVKSTQSSLKLDLTISLDEDRNVLCRICECQDSNHVFLSALRQCLRSTLVTLFSSLCKLRLEAIIYFISSIDRRFEECC